MQTVFPNELLVYTYELIHIYIYIYIHNYTYIHTYSIYIHIELIPAHCVLSEPEILKRHPATIKNAHGTDFREILPADCVLS